MTITLPPEIELALAEEAQRRRTTPEQLAIDWLRERCPVPPEHELSLEEFDAILKELDEELAPALDGKILPDLPLTREEIYQDHP